MSNRETAQATASGPNLQMGGILQRKCASCAQHTVAGGGCSDCEKKKGLLQRRASSNEPASEVPPIVHDVLRSPGQPLDASTRAFMEPRFGNDFSHVRVHTDARARESARTVNALAYTVGGDMVFGETQYAPGTESGRRLIAHELTHVVQQSQSPTLQSRTGIGDPFDPYEKQADSMADEVMRGVASFKQPAGPSIKPVSANLAPQRAAAHEADSNPFLQRTAGRQFDEQREDPECPTASTGIGDVQPEADCPETTEDISATGKRFHFCRDSDVFLFSFGPAEITEFARGKAAGSMFKVHGYASIEGQRDYNIRLSCHRAKRVARELMNAGVPSQQIEIAHKGATTQFTDDLAGGNEEAKRAQNRVVVVDAQDPQNMPAEQITIDNKLSPEKQIEQKKQIVNRAKEWINQRQYRLEADAYASFWTCGRVPTVRDAINGTNLLVEGETSIGGSSVAEGGTAEGKGLNTIVISDKTFKSANQLECVARRMIDMSFHHKVNDPDITLFPDKDSMGIRHKAGMFLAQLTGIPGCPFEQTEEDPFKGQTSDCVDAPLPGPLDPKKGVKVGQVPTFEADQTTVSTSKAVIWDLDKSKNLARITIDEPPFVADAIVSLRGNAAEFPHYDIGYVQTLTKDETVIHYAFGNEVKRTLPVPIRDSNGQPVSPPWFADDAFINPDAGARRVFVSMAKDISTDVPWEYEDLQDSGIPQLNNVVSNVERNVNFTTWLVARRNNPEAPLDRFSTHFLKDTGRVTNATLKVAVTGEKGTGDIATANRAGADDESRVMQFGGPTPQDVGPKETTTFTKPPKGTKISGPCAGAFDPVSLALAGTSSPKSVADAADTDPNGVDDHLIPVVAFGATKSVDYTPMVKIVAPDDATAKNYEVGLIQNVQSVDRKSTYTSGAQVSFELPKTPMKDGVSPKTPDPNFGVFDPIFVGSKFINKFNTKNDSKLLVHVDMPSMLAFRTLGDEPVCGDPKATATVVKMELKDTFRTWVAVRHRPTQCIQTLQHIDWKTNFENVVQFGAGRPKALEISESMVVTDAAGDGSPAFVHGAPVANDSFTKQCGK